MDWFKSLLEFLKLTPKNITPIILITALFLFSPKELLEDLNVFSFVENYRIFISVIFLFSSVMLVTNVIFSILGAIDNLWFKKRIESKIKQRLHSLTEDEKQILRFYISQNTRANTLRYDDGIVRGLESASIIYRSSSLGNMVDGFAYNIGDFAWEYLNRNYHYLNGTTSVYRTDRREW